MIPLTRRHFLAASAVAMGAIPMRSAPVPSRVSAFDLQQVRLRRGMCLDAAEINRRYVMGLEPGQLLHMFRVTAGLPSTAQPLGGWEQPANELRGHFVGHYLSACAQLSASMGDDAAKKRGELMVAELAKCQKAIGNGYLSAFPEELFDRLRAGERVWAPYYTVHKIMAGLLDMYTYCGSEQALDMLKGMAGWIGKWTGPLGDLHMARVLEVEYGGMNDVLYNLYGVTGDQVYFDLAHKFDHERLFGPLADERDELKGLHVNTQIPKIIGAARRYELSDDARSRRIAEYFWREVTGRRSFCTGGTSSDEGWGDDPGKLAGQLGGYTQECCCTYNMLKLTRHLFEWSPDPRYADYYERAFYNGILGTQHPEDGMTLYYVPLASGYWKLFGLPLDAFWCCTGTGVESFSKLGNSVYFHDRDSLWINMYIPTELNWADKGITVTQDTAFPEEETIRISVRAKSPVELAVNLRIPWWAASGGSVKLNGRPIEAFASPSSYLVLNRTWQDGDKIEFTLPMGLYSQSMPDNESIRAFLYGPVVLVGDLGSEGLTKQTLRAEPTKLRDIPHYPLDPVKAPDLHSGGKALREWLQPVAGRKLEFRITGQDKDIALMPFYRLLDKRYAVYWTVKS